jgi:hypothetical protein
VKKKRVEGGRKESKERRRIRRKMWCRRKGRKEVK